MVSLIVEIQDFATRSLEISEESPMDMLKRQLVDEDEENDDVEQLYEMRRTWETRQVTNRKFCILIEFFN